MDKSELLNRLDKRYQNWQTFLDEIGIERMDQRGVNGDWSMKDIIAHLTGWNRWLVARLQSALRGEPGPTPPWPAHLQTEDEINSWIYESNRGRLLSEVLEESHQVFQQLFAILEGLPDEIRIEQIDPAYYLVCVNEERFPVGEFFDHFHEDHEPDVRSWLARVERQGG